MEALIRKKRSVVSESCLLKQMDAWWSSKDFREMGMITGYRQYEFDPEDGYGDFVNACNEYWHNLAVNEKLEKWNLYQ